MNRTKRQCFEDVVKELNLDTSDPFTLLFANACALLDQRDHLRAENARLREALRDIADTRTQHLRSHQMQAALYSMRDIARAALANTGGVV